MFTNWLMVAMFVSLSAGAGNSGSTVERAFTILAEGMHGVSVDPGPDRQIVVTPVWNIPRPHDVFCDPDRPEVRRIVEYGIASECARIDEPPFDERQAVRRAARRVQAWLRSRSDGGVFPEDHRAGLELQDRAVARFREILREQGLYDRLLESWRRHVGAASACRDRFLAITEQQRDRFLRVEGRCAGRWEDIIEVCTGWSRDVVAHIAFHPPQSTGAPKRAGLAALIDAGLSRCLARLIERSGDEGLADVVRSLTTATERQVLDDARTRAWQVWKRAGVEDWLDRTTGAEQVPEDVAIALERCSNGTAP